VVVSIVLLIAAIAIVAVAATRMYAAGVLLYGQRPGLRAFVAAARRV
jgi:ABC-type Na+ efflux pump permease subunit